ncbi:TrmB family transcriptional regulator [Halobacteriales archaeon SW_10_66_29]|nr:MAG: TrmB family transcriptional regulator [Halobacteriales archaeon SW_10_66_29]
MSGKTDEQLAVALSDDLIELGLTEYEARTLVTLVQIGTGTAKDIADADGVPRTRVYDAAETLQNMGLIDVQYATPQRYTVISRDTIVSKLDLSRKNTIEGVAEKLEQLDTTEPATEQFGTWTVAGHDAVNQRVQEFIDEADNELIYLTVDEYLTEDTLDELQNADDRGLDIYIGGISDDVRDRIQDAVPSATLFETLWEWTDTPAGTLLITDEQTALVSVRVEEVETEDTEEVAIWGTGHRNSLVVVLRAIFTWQLETYEE